VAYGLQVYNADGRVQVDTTEIAPNAYITNIAAHASSGMQFPPANTVAGDLIVARPTNTPQSGTTVISRGQPQGGVDYFWGASQYPSYFPPNTAGIITAVMRTQAGIAAPTSGEYGMDVYSTNGSTVLFSATRSTSVRVLAQGLLGPNSSYTYTPSASLDFQRIYAVVNSSMVFSQPQSFVFPSWVINLCYIFSPYAQTKTIEVVNKVYSSGYPVSNYSGQLPYMLIYDNN
jgi:hypothetical protein